MNLKTPSFLNFTNLPTDIKIADHCIYLTNLDAHKINGSPNEYLNDKVVLNDGDFVDGKVFPIRPTIFREEVPDSNKEYTLELKNICGRTLITKYSCGDSLRHSRNHSPLGAKLLSLAEKKALLKKDRFQTQENSKRNKELQFLGGEPTNSPGCSKYVYFDMKSIQAGWFFVEVSPNKEPSSTDERYFIYSGQDRYPSILFDIFLIKPTFDLKNQRYYPKNQRYYPLQKENGEIKVTPQDYSISFQRRSTIWKYYIVIPKNHIQFFNLEILENGQKGFEKNVNFKFLDKRPFEGDAEVSIFESDTKLALEEVSPYNLKLAGTKNENDDKIRSIVKRLPIASVAQINIEKDRGLAKVSSDIYVYV